MMMIVFAIFVGEHVVKLEKTAQDSLMKVICLHLGGCFIGMMGLVDKYIELVHKNS
jgi:UDP-N-acetylmuramyl pentapeptide phosphotransferase/UDP-N-acetylglucosamine-1-phosphate transferase